MTRQTKMSRLSFVYSTDWNQGLFAESAQVHASSHRVSLTRNYQRDIHKVNWHNVKYLLLLVYENILDWPFLLHLILW